MSAEPLGATGRSPVRRDVYGRARAVLGDPSPLACTVTLTAIQVARGGDGIDTLLRWITPELRDALTRQHSLSRRAGRRGAPDARIVRARVCRVSRDAAEVSVIAAVGERTHPVAMRLEDWSGRWVVTVLDLG
ncbi:Rv3235 family protein [Demequina sp. SYSU T00039]|uniref:Rv3235 family protein n=1 Tax=Demequina lignilytica TaxID=3051663 RepID=A0AAW7M5Q3_9MICO|nr:MULTISPECIES: Rv3235 family protein [unclassified Demequina]MDN4478285.1 Rv3235 family protein [Demequina sp. SYSU T00039-1]MDN4489085.1 Rv3235 family protein [Demequina sp. SYSU T00039]MDN4490188.1 Rv3235 family protein [Demequina sp. SYSU T00068]